MTKIIAVTTRDRQLAIKSLRWFMDFFLFSWGGNAGSNCRLIAAENPLLRIDLQKRRDYGGKRLKNAKSREQKYRADPHRMTILLLSNELH
jgi:hypothetical protein